MARWNFLAIPRAAEPSVPSAFGSGTGHAQMSRGTAWAAALPRGRARGSFLQPLAPPRCIHASFLER